MKISNISARCTPLPEGLTQLCGHSIAINDDLLVFSGYNSYSLWTPNFSGEDFNEKQPKQAIGYKISFNNSDINSEQIIFDFSRFIGSSISLQNNNLVMYTYGGIYQKLIQFNKSYKLVSKISNDLFVHSWNSAGQISKQYKVNPDIITNDEEIIRKGYGILAVEAQNPAARMFHGSAWDKERKFLWIFGGCTKINTTFVKLNDLWYFNTKTNKWRQAECDPPESNCMFQNLMYKNDYLFTVTEDQIWTMKLEDLNDLHWESLQTIPEEIRIPINGSQVFIIRSPLLEYHIMLIGGTEKDYFDKISSSERIREENEKQNFSSNLKMWSYSLTSSSFKSYAFKSNIPHIAYHSIALGKDFLYCVGGLCISNNESNSVIFNRNIFSIKLVDLFLNEVKMFNFPFHSKTCFINVNNVTVTKILSNLETVNKSTNFLKQIQNYKNECDHPFPPDEYIRIGKLACSKSLAFSRLKKWTTDFVFLPEVYINDLFVYCHTDFIQTNQDRPFIFKDFLYFMKLLRDLKIYHLMWLEFSVEINKMTFRQFVDLISLQNYGPALGDDPNFLIGKAILIQLLNEIPDSYFSLPIITNLMKLHDFSFYLTSRKKNITIKAPFTEPLRLPKSTYLSDTCMTKGKRQIHKCKDGFIIMNSNELKIQDFTNFRYEIVLAVFTHNYKRYLSDKTDFNEMIEIINSSEELSYTVVNSVLGENRELLLQSFESFPDLTLQYIETKQINLVRFIIETLSLSPVAYFENGQGEKFGLSKICPITKLPQKIKVELNKKKMPYLALLFYTNFNFNKFELIANKNQIMLIVLDLISNNQNLFPQLLMYHISKYIISYMQNPDRTLKVDIFTKYFNHFYKAGLHKKLISFAADDSWARILTQNSDSLTKDQLEWILDIIGQSDIRILHKQQLNHRINTPIVIDDLGEGAFDNDDNDNYYENYSWIYEQ